MLAPAKWIMLFDCHGSRGILVMAAKFEVYADTAGEFRFRLKAGNGEIILTSEGYRQKASAMHGISSVQKNAAEDKHYDRKTTSAGKPMFTLKAANGQVIGSSQSYSSEAAREKGIDSVKHNAPDAGLSDLTQ